MPRRLIGALVLTATLNPLNSTMIAVALPAIATTFAVSSGSVTTWLVTSFLIVNIVAVSPAGKLGDLLGRRRALWLGQGILAGGALLGGLSPLLSGVVAGRILMAVGGAIVIPTTMAALRGAFPPERRARVFALMGTLMGTAAACGPVLGGLIAGRVGWHAIFLINAPVLLLAGLLGRETPEQKTPGEQGRRSLRGFDVVGAALLGLGLGAGAIGLRLAAWGWALTVAGGGCLVAFVVWERRVERPLIDLRLFRERHFVAGGLVVALQNLSMYALLFQLPFLFEGPLGIGPERAGVVLMTMMVAMLLSAPVGGRVSERIGVRSTVLGGLLVTTAGLALALQAIRELDLRLLVVCLAATGAGLGFVTGPVQAAALSAVSAGVAGVASGVLSTLRYVGGVLGIGAISVLLGGGSTAEVVAGHQRCVWVYLAAHAVALGLAMLLPPRLESRLAASAGASGAG